MPVLAALSIAVPIRAVQNRDTSAPAVKAPLTPGRLALEMLTVDAEEVPVLRAAINDPDPEVRTVAARIVSGLLVGSVAPALATALAVEGDGAARAEQVRALLSIGGDESRRTVEASLRNGDMRATEVYVHWLQRTRPEQVADVVGQLYAATASADLPALGKALLSNAAPLTPELRERILRTWLETIGAKGAPGRRQWAAALGALASTEDSVPAAVVREALQSRHPIVRRETVWALLTRVVDESKTDERLLAAAARLDPEGAGADADSQWESYGRELLARRVLKVRATDRSAVVNGAGMSNRGALEVAVRSEASTPEERASIRRLFGDDFLDLALRKRRVLAPPLQTQPTVSVVDPVTPRLLATLVEAAGCPVAAEPRLAGFEASYRRDGGPAHVRVDLGNVPAGCQAVVRTLASLVTAHPDLPITENTSHWHMLPLSTEFVACASDYTAAPQESAAGDSDAPAAPIVAPKRTRYVNPYYPPSAQKNRSQGVVGITAVISAGGCVVQARVSRSVVPTLDLAAVGAVVQWRYTPATIGGRAVPVTMDATVNFSLR